jgi:formate C-acetyltransferase
MPVDRLSAATHDLARRALSGEWGRGLVDVKIDIERYVDPASVGYELLLAHAALAVATEAPLRIVPGERLVGAATLRRSTWHAVPVYRAGDTRWSSVSHTTLGFDRALRVGLGGLRSKVERRLSRGHLDAKGDETLRAMRLCLDAMALWHRRYMELLAERIAASDGDERRGYEALATNFHDVPERPPRSFREAVQALWFLFAFHRLCGNWPGLGRIDKMLGPYLAADLASGAITLDEAREWIAHFWIKGCEWMGAVTGPGNGDAQFYQNIVLGGVDEAGRDLPGDVTHLVLDVVEELRISEFPIAVRIGGATPERLLRRIAEVQRLGAGIVAVYNEPQIIESLVAFGYPLEEARDFANDGCWEILVPGRTSFGYLPFDTLAILQKLLGVTGDAAPPECADFEALYAEYRARLREEVRAIHARIDGTLGAEPGGPLVSLFVEDCIERARDYRDGGPRYTVRSPHAGGLPDTGNCLYVLKKLVFDERRIGLGEFVDVLRRDWQGREALRQEIVTRFDLYGNDSAEADGLVRRVFDDFLAAVAEVKERAGVLRPAGVSTFGREIEWRRDRGATAVGRRRDDILALNFSPSPGTDRRGPTAVIKSHAAMNLARLTNGTALELKLHPTSVEGEAGLQALMGLLRTFVKLGGIFMHIDVVDNAVLRDAQEHPEQHQGLAVRVSGWSARFVTLDRSWQEMVIGRTTQDGA